MDENKRRERPFVEGADWSVGVNSAAWNALSYAKLLGQLGVGLRAMYGDVEKEPVPDHLKSYLDRLNRRDDT